jgi:hypothetical protein
MRSVHAGTFDIDFSQFGLRVATREALGWSPNARSYSARLNPTVADGGIQLEGELRGDTLAVGIWQYNAGSGGALGRFELRRARAR